MKKILLVSNMYPSEKYPHYGIFVQHSADILSNNGYNVKVVALEKTTGKFAKIVKYFVFYFKVICRIWFSKYDIIYAHYASHTALPILIGVFFRHIPIVTNVHGNDVVAESAADEKYFGLVRKLLLKSRKVICPSEYFKTVLVSDFSVEYEKITVYPSGGVDVDFFRNIDRQSALDYFRLDASHKYVGYVSRIEKNKGWDIFLMACSKVLVKNPKIKIVVVGDGTEDRQFEQMVDSLKLRDKLIKFNLLPHKDIIYIYNLLDVFVFPSYRKSESLGLVGLEAMACEDIVILPDKYGPSSYADDNVNCFVFTSGDAESLENAVIKGLNGNASDLMKKEARNTATRYSHEYTDKILISCFEGLQS